MISMYTCLRLQACRNVDITIMTITYRNNDLLRTYLHKHGTSLNADLTVDFNVWLIFFAEIFMRRSCHF